MKELIRLCDIEPNEHATVHALKNDGPMRRRLYDLGLIEDTVVECVGKSPMGDPAAYLIRGAVIAIRRADSAQIIVELRGQTWD